MKSLSLFLLVSFVGLLSILSVHALIAPELSTLTTSQNAEPIDRSLVRSAPSTALSPNAVECGANPTDGCVVTQSTTFVKATYSLPTGITLRTNNTFVDCNGSTIQNGQRAFDVQFVNNVTIRNCTINNYSNPIYLSNANYSTIKDNIINNSFVDGSSGGYAIIGTDGFAYNNFNTITNNVITKSAKGGILITGVGNTISQNKFMYNGPIGVWLVDLNANFTISNNYFLNNSRAILTDLSGYTPTYLIENGSIFNNTAINSTTCGIWLRRNSTKIQVYQNSVHHNYAGVCIELNTGNNTIRENNITQNSYSGLHFYIATNNKVYLNNIYNNPVKNTESDAAHELQYNEIGNYWGHTVAPCFVAGSDSNRADLIDRNATCGYVRQYSTVIPFSAPGWYFFSFFVQPNTPATGTLLKPLAGKYEIVQAYLNSVPSKYIPGAPSSLTKLDTWKSYWIKLTTQTNTDLVIVGNRTTSCFLLNLTTGTNPKHWVGYWVDQPKPVAIALNSIAGNYETVKTYNNGAWQTYNPSLPQFSDLTVMVPGQGYLIKITNPDALDYLCG